MDAVAPHPIVRPDLIDDKGNLRAADIGMTWQGSDTFLHGVKVVGPNDAEPPLRPSTGDVDALRTGMGTCFVSHVDATTGTTVMFGSRRQTTTPDHPGESSGLLTGRSNPALQ